MAGRTVRVSALLGYLLDGVPASDVAGLQPLLGGWLDASNRFVAFVEAHRDKIRKKLRVATEPGARADVLAEVETAFLLLADRRIELAFEAYGSGQRGPDFTATFRSAHRFNLEVTRPRRPSSAAENEQAIARAVLAKLRQLPADSPNALLIASGLAASPADAGAAMRALKLRSDRRDEAYFAARGMSNSEFQLHYRRLGVLFVANATGAGVHAWANPESRRRLPEGAAAACLAALANARWGTTALGAPPAATGDD